jgi:succinoglycan biosynthesis protein ExoO
MDGRRIGVINPDYQLLLRIGFAGMETDLSSHVPDARRDDGNQPIVSVIISVYNSELTLAAAIESVLGQSLQNLELLIVDDGSIDGSAELARKAADADNRARVIRLEQNGGKPRAMNCAIDMVRGRWVAVLDADDTFHPQRLERLIELGERHGTAMVSDDQNHIDHISGKVVKTAFQGYRFANPVGRGIFVRIARNPHRDFDLGILKTVIRTDFIRRTGLRYNELAGLGEDFYYLLDFFIRGGTVWISHDALYNWTLPFSPSSRQWTTTGYGAWRYDHRRMFPAHNQYVATMKSSAEADMLDMLLERGRRMLQMMYYTDAQKAAAEGRPFEALRILALHPITYPLLLRRILRRYRRELGKPANDL